MKKSTMTGGFKNDPDALPPEVASGAGKLAQEGESSPDSGESPSETTSGAEGTDEPPPTPASEATAPIAMPVEPDLQTATSGIILKFLEAMVTTRRAIRKQEDVERSAERKKQDAADNEVDKAWRGIMRLRLAKENRDKAMKPAAPQLPLE